MQAQQQKRLRATFDHKANPHRLYVEVETDGSLNPQEVVMKVPSHYHIFFILLCEIMTRIFSNIITLQGLTELQTELVLGLKSDPTELDTRWRRRRTTPTGQRHDAGTGSTPKGSRVGAVGEPLQRVGVPHGVEAQVQGHLPQQGGWGITGTTTNAAASGASAWGAAGSGWGTGDATRNTAGWSSPNQTQSACNMVGVYCLLPRSSALIYDQGLQKSNTPSKAQYIQP